MDFHTQFAHKLEIIHSYLFHDRWNLAAGLQKYLSFARLETN